MDLFLEILVQFGLPVAAAAVMGIFIYIILKYILAGVVGQVGTITMLISALDNRHTDFKCLKLATRFR
jgi:hypothetical protein